MTLNMFKGDMHPHAAGSSAVEQPEYYPVMGISRLTERLNDSSLEQVAIFMDTETILARRWELFYLWSDYHFTAKPVIFIGKEQFSTLLAELAAVLRYELHDLEHFDCVKSLAFTFPFDHEDLRPRYLGTSTSIAEYERLQNSVETIRPKDTGVDAKIVEQFRCTMEAAISTSMTKPSAKFIGAAAGRLRYSRYMLECVRSYIRSTGPESSDPVLFIAVDCEAYEMDRSSRRVTEVGVAIIDTLDLRGSAGEHGVAWHKNIRARHFLVKEYQHLVNSKFVHGCPDKFEYGSTELVTLKDLPQALAGCFREPYGASQGNGRRRLVLVGHGIQGDVAMCQSIGFSLTGRSDIIMTVDTSQIDAAITSVLQQRSLSALVSAYDLAAWHPHNAGNDAVYTLWALLALATDNYNCS